MVVVSPLLYDLCTCKLYGGISLSFSVTLSLCVMDSVLHIHVCVVFLLILLFYFILLQAHKNQTSLSMITRLKCAAGLAEMEGRKYKNAARYFLQASFDHCQCPDVS